MEERDQGGCRARCRHLDHGTHFASLISRKDSVRVTGVFRLQAGAPGDPRLLRSLTVWYLNSKTRASQPTPFLSFLIVLVSLAAFPNVFPSFLILPSNLTSVLLRPPPPCSPPLPPSRQAPSSPPALACPPTVPPSGHPSATLCPPQPPRSTKAQSIKYSKKPARIRAVLLPLSPYRHPAAILIPLLASSWQSPSLCYFFVPGPPRLTPP